MTSNYMINYVNLIENILALICQLLSIALIGRLLWDQRKKSGAKSRFSSIFTCYLLAEWSMTIGCLPFRIYYIFWWNEQLNGYNSWVQFWVSIGNSNYLAVSTWPTFFLTIERCLAIQLPLAGHTFKRRMLIGSISAIVLFYGLSTASLFAFAMPNASGNVAIFKNQSQLVIKCTSGVANLIASALFLHLLKRSGLKNIKNRIAVVTMFCELFMNTLPNLTNYLLISTINFGLSSYVGSFGAPLAALECAICAIYYSVVIHMPANQMSSSDRLQKQNSSRQPAVIDVRVAAKTILVRPNNAEVARF